MVDYNMQVRMPTSEVAAYRAAAEISGTTLSAWVRDRLRKASRQELQASGIKVPFLEEYKND